MGETRWRITASQASLHQGAASVEAMTARPTLRDRFEKSAYGAAIRVWHMAYHGRRAAENCSGGWRNLVPAFVGIEEPSDSTSGYRAGKRAKGRK